MADYQFSRALIKILRHDYSIYGLQMQEGGYIDLEDILNLSKFHGKTVTDVRTLVQRDDKNRYDLDEKNGRLRIRATQGHSVKVDLNLKPIRESDVYLYPNVLHGTKEILLDQIKQEGLSRMGRTHIHFAPGEPGDANVISGPPSYCDIFIYIDLRRAIRDGIPFFVSDNNVILSPGDDNGVIKSKYFQKIVQRISRRELSLY